MDPADPLSAAARVSTMASITRRGKMANAHRLKIMDARSLLIFAGSVAINRGDARRLDLNPKVQ